MELTAMHCVLSPVQTMIDSRKR